MNGNTPSLLRVKVPSLHVNDASMKSFKNVKQITGRVIKHRHGSNHIKVKLE
jgi:hypothetical protein